MPNRNYINQLPVELISHIFAYLGASDILKCLLVSKRFYNIATSSDFIAPLYVYSGRFAAFRPYGNAERIKVSYFLSKFANGIIIDSLGFIFDQPQSLVCSDVVSFISFMGSYKIRELWLKAFSSQLLNTMTSNQFANLLYLRDLQLLMEGDTMLNLNSLQNLPHAVPNLESLEVSRISDDLFQGTESFDNLKTICFSGMCRDHLLPVITSFVKKMPRLTKFACCFVFILGLDFEGPTDLFESLPNLESVHLSLTSSFIPIDSPKLKELRLGFYAMGFYSPLVAYEEQIVPLSYVETFETVADFDNISRCLKYYGIGDNLKTLCLFDMDEYETHVDLEPDLWKSFPKLENLYLCQYSIDAKYLLNIAESCKNLRLVAFHCFLNEDEYHAASLADLQPLADYGGIKEIYLREKLPKKLTNFLLDNGIDVHVVGHEYFSAWYHKARFLED